MHAFCKALEGMGQEPDRSRALFTEAWAWREQLQRAMDGCHSTDDMSAHSLSEYDEYEGPNIPLPSGYQVPLKLLLAPLPVLPVLALEAWTYLKPKTCTVHSHSKSPAQPAME